MANLRIAEHRRPYPFGLITSSVVYTRENFPAMSRLPRPRRRTYPGSYAEGLH